MRESKAVEVDESPLSVGADMATQLDRTDQLALAIAYERVRSAEAERRAADAMLRAALLERRIVLDALTRRYALSNGDGVDYESGAITRVNGKGVATC